MTKADVIRYQWKNSEGLVKYEQPDPWEVCERWLETGVWK